MNFAEYKKQREEKIVDDNTVAIIEALAQFNPNYLNENLDTILFGNVTPKDFEDTVTLSSKVLNKLKEEVATEESNKGIGKYQADIDQALEILKRELPVRMNAAKNLMLANIHPKTNAVVYGIIRSTADHFVNDMLVKKLNAWQPKFNAVAKDAETSPGHKKVDLSAWDAYLQKKSADAAAKNQKNTEKEEKLKAKEALQAEKEAKKLNKFQNVMSKYTPSVSGDESENHPNRSSGGRFGSKPSVILGSDGKSMYRTQSESVNKE